MGMLCVPGFLSAPPLPQLGRREDRRRAAHRRGDAHEEGCGGTCPDAVLAESGGLPRPLLLPPVFRGEARVRRACGRNGSRGGRKAEGAEGALFFKGISAGPVRFPGFHLSNLYLFGGGPLAYHPYPQALGGFPD